MDVKGFADELLVALAATGLFERVSFQTEGPIASGRVYVQGPASRFLRIYFNETTGTIAFALIRTNSGFGVWITIIGEVGIFIRSRILQNTRRSLP